MVKELTPSAVDEVFEDEPQVADADLDPGAWLARDDTKRMGRVQVSGGTLKVGALTNREYDALRAKVRRVNPANPRDPDGIVDSKKLSRLLVAYAINKAHGWARLEGSTIVMDSNGIAPEALDGKLTGDVLELMRGILALSGLVEADQRQAPVPFEV